MKYRHLGAQNLVQLMSEVAQSVVCVRLALLKAWMGQKLMLAADKKLFNHAILT